MKMHQATIEISTRGRGFTNLGPRIASVIADSGVKTGLAVVFVQHTSASLVIQENADPEDDMPAHLRSAITNISETIPITDGRLALGTWQAIYLWEHRKSPHTRTIVVHVQGL